MNRFFIIKTGLLAYTFLLYFQSIGQPCDFQSPLKTRTVLSGSFAEPRTGHFHSGVDYKQHYGIPRDTIYAVASGFLSRIVIKPDGYGNALYITHSCGRTSVYAHLHSLHPKIRSYIDEIMQQEQLYAIDHNVPSGILPVSQGSFIGIMGSTGRSSGPHLHFEIRDTKTEQPINPAQYGFKPKDNIPPVIRGIMIYTLTPDGQELTKQYMPAIKVNNTLYQLSRPIIEFGALLVGIGIHTYDQMNGANNHNGIYALQLKVDGQPQFGYTMNRLDFSTSKYIHAHMDYEAKMDNKYIMKCFRNSANPLTFYKESGEKGVIALYDRINRHIQIKVSDIEDNQAIISFEIKRSDSLAPLPSHPDGTMRLSPEDSLLVRGKYTDIYIPKNSLAAPVFLNIRSDSVSIIDLRQTRKIALYNPIKIRKRLIVEPKLRQKQVLYRVDKKGRLQSYRGSWSSDRTWIVDVDQLDLYYVGMDTIPPKIKAISLPNGQRRRGSIVIEDNFTPNASVDAVVFDVYLDGQWLLCQHDIKTHKIWWDMPLNRQNQEHHLSVIARDAAQNESTLERTFYY